jgi:regulator of sigma E protease
MIDIAWNLLAHWAVPVIFVITAIVFIHELGHYSMARLFKVRIETFSIGFGGEIFGWTDKRGTRWKLSWLPVGGYVRFFGDADAASRPDSEAGESMTAEERAVALQFKPLWQRALVVAAGPFANFALTIVVFTVMLSTVGHMVVPPVIGSVQAGSPAQAAGIRPGDVIRDIDGTKIDDFFQVPQIVQTAGIQEHVVTLARGAQTYTVHITPKIVQRKELGSQEAVPLLGVGASDKVKPVVVRYGPVAALGESCRETWAIITGSLNAFGRLLTGRAEAQQLHGTISIVVMTKHVADLGILPLIQLIAVLSVSIGLINLFPIPVLDGGHLLYYGCEAVLGRPLGERAQEVGFRFGLALILGLVLFSFWNDLAHHLNLF